MPSFSCSCILGCCTQGGRSADCRSSTLVVIWLPGPVHCPVLVRDQLSATVILLSWVDARRLSAYRPCLGGVGSSSGSNSPKQGRCAAKLARRPCLGESLLLERGIGRISAQRLGSGETRRFGQGRAAAFPQVGALALLASSPKPGSCAPVFLPSRDVVPESAVFGARIRQTLPSQDVAQDERRIVLAWERLSRLPAKSLPSRDLAPKRWTSCAPLLAALRHIPQGLPCQAITLPGGAGRFGKGLLKQAALNKGLYVLPHGVCGMKTEKLGELCARTGLLGAEG